MSIIGLRRISFTFVKCFRYRSTEAVKPIEELSKQKSSTLDKKEVEFHSNLSEVWWDVTGRMKALHSMNPLRVQLIRDGLANAGLKEANPSTPLDGIKILDVGCGGGILSEPLARIGATVTGLDASTQLISTAKEHASLDKNISGRLSYVASTIEDHTSSNQATYDVVVASEIIEHITDQEFFLKSCTNVVKPGGSIFITTPGKTASSWLVAILMAEYVLRIIPQGTHDWNKFISPEETQRLLEKCGCKTKLIHGISYNPLNNKWSWSSSPSIFYALHAIKSLD